MSGEKFQARAQFDLEYGSELSSNKAVTELISLLEANGRKPQARELSYMISAIDKMGEQYSELLTMARNDTKELSKDIEKYYSPTERRPDLSMYQVTQNEAEQALPLFAAAKEKIIIGAKTAVEEYRQTGMDGLDATLSALNVRDIAIKLRNQGDISALKIVRQMILAEMKDAVWSAYVVSSRSIRACRKMLSSVRNTIHTVFGSAEHLAGPTEPVEKAHIAQTAQKQGEHLEKKPSIRQVIKNNQAEIAAKPTPTQDKAKKQEIDL